MAMCPFATPRLLPENQTEPIITPTQLIYHSIVGSAEGAYQFFKNSSNLESHFIVKLDGGIWQLMDTRRQADANTQANARAISVETEDNGHPDTFPWTVAQLNALVDLGRWVVLTHDVPTHTPSSWNSPGIGYHRMYPEWLVGPKSCPGNIRVQQFHSYLLPHIQEDDMTVAEFNEAMKQWAYRMLLFQKTGQANSYINTSSMPDLFDPPDEPVYARTDS